MGEIRERVIENNRSSVLAGVAAAGALAGAVSKDPEWLKKKAKVIA